jgi:hypothetical protein
MRKSALVWVATVCVACGGSEGDDRGDGETTGAMTSSMMDDDATAGPMADDDGDSTPMPDPTADPLDDGDDGDDGDGTTGDGDDTGDDPPLECAAYCDTYMSACIDYNAYANMQDCMDQCGQWPVGAADDTETDSLGCRLYHVTVASAAEPDLHCPHAGPNGGGVCIVANAPSCEDYCDTYFDNCTDDLNAYADMDDCMTQCDAWYPGSTRDTAGHTIGCRTYHGGAPAVGAPDDHCPHAGPGGGGVCVFAP